MVEQQEASTPMIESAYDLEYELPRGLEDALKALSKCSELAEVLGDSFVQAYCAVKEKEFETFSQGITAWEREHLQLLV
jgi:glutamine synthetase